MPSILDTEKLQAYIFDLTYPHLTHTYSKARNADNPKILQDIENNYNIVLKHFNGKKLILLNQVHGNCIIDADFLTASDIQEEADGLITTQKEIIIGIYIADCVPVLFYSEDNQVIGAAHCGWKSARLDIIQKIYEMMKAKGAGHIQAIIGPSIAQESYEVSLEFYENFMNYDLYNQQFFIPSRQENHFMFNLPAYVKHKLNECGISNIKHLEEDTYTNSDKYPSFRRSTHQKSIYSQNFLSAIMLKP